MTRQTILIDFDGVIHRYGRGWQDGSIYDDMMPGFVQWATKAFEVFDLAVYSSRSAHADGLGQMQQWMRQQLMKRPDFTPESAEIFVRRLYWPLTKSPAWLTIDDRCVPFLGSWLHPSLDPQRLAAFKPWNKDGGSLLPALVEDLHNAEKENDCLRRALRWAMARLMTVDRQELQELIDQGAVPDATDDLVNLHNDLLDMVEELDALVSPYVEEKKPIPDPVALKLEPLLSKLRGIERGTHQQPTLFPRQVRRAAGGG